MIPGNKMSYLLNDHHRSGSWQLLQMSSFSTISVSLTCSTMFQHAWIKHAKYCFDNRILVLRVTKKKKKKSHHVTPFFCCFVASHPTHPWQNSCTASGNSRFQKTVSHNHFIPYSFSGQVGQTAYDLSGFYCLQGWRPHNFSGQPAALSDSLQ